ncbi:Major viral transcription factor [Quillaja saponaria]|uniref:Major viral transcription factor n=1 Tax=Quillaja saponaria TaxID=32244 RepID=A0AAD7KX07_QUISA|nr:Major viral transcription factor [Quillaja saponaria]
MDNNDNFSKRESKSSGKPPTRLQKQAPASLQLDQAAGTTPANPYYPSPESSRAIPLLSPLILSPQPLPGISVKENRLPGNGNNEGQGNSSAMQGTRWQHPAVAPFTEPSSLFSFFQAQCGIVNRAR